jgi:hypothetical protein
VFKKKGGTVRRETNTKKQCGLFSGIWFIRILLLIALMVTLSIGTFACKAGGTDPSGTWTCTKGSNDYDKGNILELKSDKTLFVYNPGESGVSGTWKIEGEIIYLVFDFVGMTWKGNIKENTLTLEEGSTWVKGNGISTNKSGATSSPTTKVIQSTTESLSSTITSTLSEPHNKPYTNQVEYVSFSQTEVMNQLFIGNGSTVQKNASWDALNGKYVRWCCQVYDVVSTNVLTTLISNSCLATIEFKEKWSDELIKLKPYEYFYFSARFSSYLKQTDGGGFNTFRLGFDQADILVIPQINGIYVESPQLQGHFEVSHIWIQKDGRWLVKVTVKNIGSEISSFDSQKYYIVVTFKDESATIIGKPTERVLSSPDGIAFTYIGQNESYTYSSFWYPPIEDVLGSIQSYEITVIKKY